MLTVQPDYVYWTQIEFLQALNANLSLSCSLRQKKIQFWLRAHTKRQQQNAICKHWWNKN